APGWRWWGPSGLLGAEQCSGFGDRVPPLRCRGELGGAEGEAGGLVGGDTVRVERIHGLLDVVQQVGDDVVRAVSGGPEPLVVGGGGHQKVSCSSRAS